MIEGRSLAFEVLDRHTARRGQGLPTVSSLIALTDSAAVAQWEIWARRRGLQTVYLKRASPELLLSDLFSMLADSIDFYALALRCVGSSLGKSLDETRHLIRSRTTYDFEVFWTILSLPNATRDTEIIVHELCLSLCAATVGETRNEATQPLFQLTDSVLREWDAKLNSHGKNGWRVLTAICALLLPEELPAVLVVPSQSLRAASWIACLAPRLSDLAEAVPQWTVGFAAGRTAFDEYRKLTPEGRTKTLLECGIVDCDSSDAASAVSQLPKLDVDPQHLPQGIWRQVSPPGESSEAAEPQMEPGLKLGDTDDNARSAAERLLFQLLESLAETRGCFTLNAPLDFHFGAQWAEVDLWAANLRLAVEIDGYHHFTDAQHYRRDRRKDWELQSRGIRVLRVLADDVLAQTQEVLDQILAATKYCRKTSMENLP